MKEIQKKTIVILVFLFCISTFYSFPSRLTDPPQAHLPVLITSCGQSPGATMLKVIFMRLKLDFQPKAYEVNPLATSDDLKAMIKAGTPFKSMIIVMGASLKGMGAAGISIDDELSRIGNLIEEARAQNITIIGAHIEGMKRRAQGAVVGDNTDELSIDKVAPNCDFLIINKEGNTDNRFTVIADEKNLPLVEVEKNLDLLEELSKIFKK